MVRAMCGTLCSVLLTEYYSGDQIKKTEMGRVRSMCGREVHTGFWWGNLRVGDHLEDPKDLRVVGWRGHGLDRSGSG
jgi:hypothetical protein